MCIAVHMQRMGTSNVTYKQCKRGEHRAGFSDGNRVCSLFTGIGLSMPCVRRRNSNQHMTEFDCEIIAAHLGWNPSTVTRMWNQYVQEGWTEQHEGSQWYQHLIGQTSSCRAHTTNIHTYGDMLYAVSWTVCKEAVALPTFNRTAQESFAAVVHWMTHVDSWIAWHRLSQQIPVLHAAPRWPCQCGRTMRTDCWSLALCVIILAQHLELWYGVSLIMSPAHI